MEINRCVGCMAETKSYPCPHCGFDPARQEQPSYALPANSILNARYLVGRVLGQGGFGITYVGWDLALEKKVAVKEFYPSGQVNRYSSAGSALLWNSSAQAQAFRQTGVESFLKEARKMAKVDDIPEVVRVRDTFQENDTAYIVMDFVEGETLRDRLKRTGPMPWSKAEAIFRPVIAAMDQVHKAGLIHRDISPDNLMLEPGGRIRILDLGAAKDLSVNNGASSILVAKNGFSPIEQYGQRGGSGPWTDVYAMAATMYYALTGVTPPMSVDRMDEDTLRWDFSQLRALPENVLTALQKAMAVSAKNRTQTMNELLAALEAPAGNPNGGQSGSKQQPDKESSPGRSKRIVIVVAVVLVCIVIGLITQMGAGSPEAESPEAESPEAGASQGETLGHTHSWVAATCTEAKHCSQCGAAEGSALGHSWREATCTEPETCTRCGITQGEPLGHTWEAATCTEPETCTRCGITQGKPLGHIWEAATYYAPKTCSVCGQTEGTTLGMPLTSCTNLQDSNQPGSQSDVAVGNWIDSFGIVHPDSIRFWVVKLPGWSETEYVVYALNGEYQSIDISVVAESSSDRNASFEIRIYADGERIYESGLVDYTTSEICDSIDVAGVNQLRIECTTDSSAFGYCIVAAQVYR